MRLSTLHSLPLIAALLGFVLPLTSLAQTSFTSNGSTAAWGTSRWNTTDAAPYTSAFIANNAVSFTSGTYGFATGMGSGNTINIGNVTLSNNVTVQLTGTTAGTYATGGAVRTLSIGSGAIYDLAAQNVSTAAGTGFIKNGDGIFKTAGSSFNGGFTLNAGTIILGGVNAMGGGALTINGGTIAANATRNVTARYTSVTIGGDFTIGGVTTGVASGNATAAANITFADSMSLGASTRKITIGSNALYTFNGAFSGSTASTGLTVAASSGATGILVLGGNNSYTGTTTVSSGTLQLGAAERIANGSNLVVDGGTLNLNGFNETVSTITISSGIINGTTNTLTGTSYALQGGTVNAILGGSGAITVSSGTTALGSAGRLGSGKALTVSSGQLTLAGAESVATYQQTGGTLAGTGNTLTSSAAYDMQAGTVSANLGGGVALNKTTVGVVTLSGSNTYSGGTTISGGTLNVTNTSGSATGTGDLSIGASATLQGSGIIAPSAGNSITVNGTVTVGALNAPPASASILTLTPESGTITTTFETGSTLHFDLFTNHPSGNNYATTTAADLLRTGGNLTFQTGVNLRVNQSGTFTFANGNQWRLLDWTTLLGNAPTGNTSELILDLPALGDPGLAWDVSALYTNGSISVVPEPSRTLFLALGLLTLTLRRRR